MSSFRVCLIGQSAFGAAVYKDLKANDIDICGVFTTPDQNGRVDLLAQAAEADRTAPLSSNRIF